LEKHESEIESITLIPSSGGRFEIMVNGQLIYSKASTKRHAEPGEVAELLQQLIQKGN
jgi:selenoprotein W-related protein